MSGFSRAHDAFQEYVIKTLGTKDISFGPNAESVTMRQTVGKAWAFFGAPSASPNKPVRGWALGDGRVITTQQSFGLLLEEAGLWAKPQGSLAMLPEVVAWALGNEYRSPGGPPQVKLVDGAGTIEFYLIHQQAGGGGSLGPETPNHVVVKVNKDHSATVTVTPQ